MSNNKFFRICLSLLLVIGVASCSNDDSNNSTGETSSRVSVKLVDAPGDYEAVYVDVEDVLVKYSGNESEVSIGTINAGVYNLLELTGGASVLLVDNEIDAGNISQIRLVLGDQNTIVVDGQTYPLSTPSAQQSGLKVNVNQTLETGVFYEFILDFDVDASVVAQGNGNYSLNPVIRATTAAESGAVTGMVLPAGIQSMVTASNGTTEVSSYTNSEGIFMLSGVPEGSYQLTVEADASLNLPPVVIPNVEVNVGSVTTIETVTMQ